MNKLLGTDLERVEWYITSHRHTFKNEFGALRVGVSVDDPILRSRFESDAHNLVDILSGFRTSADLHQHLDILWRTVDSLTHIALISSYTSEKREAIEKMVAAVQSITQGLEEVLRNPNHREYTNVSKVLDKTLVEICGLYPDKLPMYGSKRDPVQIDLVFSKKTRQKHYVSSFDMYLLFCNLVCNAIEATDRGLIRIVADYSPTDFATFSVQNPGTVSPENLAKMRQAVPFTTKPNGHGEGIPIIHDVIRKYNGSLRISSNRDLMTTTFEIDLPYKR